MMPSLITVSRHWDNPQIICKVNLEGIAIGMDMDDFIVALKSEMGIDPMDKKIDLGINNVIEKMKEESKKIIAQAGQRK
jgi:hypothetical protein